MTNPFFPNRPGVPHLVRGPGGLKGEIFDLRRELITAFEAVDTAIGTGGGGAVLDMVFDTAAPVSVGGVYRTWADLMAAIALLKPGQKPRVTFMQSFTVPVAGMPVDGWPCNLAEFRSFTNATGGIILDVPDGVKLDMLETIGEGMTIDVYPTTPYGVFNWSQFPPGGVVRILRIAAGGQFKNRGTPGVPMIVTPGAGPQTYTVFAMNYPAFQATPPGTAPWIEVMGSDVVILAGSAGVGGYGAVPDDWAQTASPTAFMVIQTGLDMNEWALSSWAGLPPYVVSGLNERNLRINEPRTLYVDASAPADSYPVKADGSMLRPFPTIQGALDKITDESLEEIRVKIAPGIYFESIVIPQVSSIKLEGEDWRTTKISAVNNNPAMTCIPNAGSDMFYAEFIGLDFMAYGQNAHAVVINGSDMPLGNAFQNGLLFTRCSFSHDQPTKYVLELTLVNGLEFRDCSTNDGGSLGTGFFQCSGVTVTSNTNMGRVEIDFDPLDPVPSGAPLTFFLVQGMSNIADAILSGLVAFITTPASSVQNIHASNLTSTNLGGPGGPGIASFMLLTGIVGNPVNAVVGGSMEVIATLPNNPLAPIVIPPALNMLGARCWASIEVSATVDPVSCDFRNAVFVDLAVASLKAHTDVVFDLRQASFKESWLDALAGGAYDRDKITVEGILLNPGVPATASWPAPLTGSVFTVAVEVTDPAMGAVGVSNKTATSCDLTTGALAAAGIANVVVLRRT